MFSIRKKPKTSEALKDKENLQERPELILFAHEGKHTFEKAQQRVKDNGGRPQAAQSDVTGSTPVFRPKPVDRATAILTIKHLKNTNS